MKKLRSWNYFRKEYIKQESPLCSICKNVAIGDFYDKDWQSIKLCKQCYNALIQQESK